MSVDICSSLFSKIKGGRVRDKTEYAKLSREYKNQAEYV